MPSISRRSHVQTLLVAVGITFAPAPHARAQDSARVVRDSTRVVRDSTRVVRDSTRVVQDSTRATGRSTLSGIYTEEQAGRGKNLFLGSCKSCHAPESQTGANFARLWMGRPLLELFKFVNQNMPDNDPGSLGPELSADIIAYLLQLNAMPAGKAELVADTTALRDTRVESSAPKSDSVPPQSAPKPDSASPRSPPKPDSVPPRIPPKPDSVPLRSPARPPR